MIEPRHSGYASVSVAHVGDARADERLAGELRGLAPDLVRLSLNGHDEARAAMRFASDMNAMDAVELAARAGIRQLPPCTTTCSPGT